ncbi:PREDICTED: putative disease [Prunus dulcis]|uniref:PREDICTED: putative disease n=1 Tax=Prunus dulcis TaxID=3755 RepID=A0A5E4EWH3_PRUDU|nr:PREDICTED: putative disease [Prunus dulcis]
MSAAFGLAQSRGTHALPGLLWPARSCCLDSGPILPGLGFVAGDPFDEIKIAKAIIEGLKKETPASNELQTLKSIIHESVKGKKFLLVLDDVWNQDYLKWEQLKLPLQNGAVGSRILVTTRKEEVARMVGAH